MKILFICTHNRCRSILAEAICRHYAKGSIESASAGSEPSGEVHPLSIKALRSHGINSDNLRSESWHVYEAWQPDVVITVCDSAAAEICPLWMGNALKVHWGLADPSRLQGSEAEIDQAFRHTINVLARRVEYLVEQAAHQQPSALWPALFKQAEQR